VPQRLCGSFLHNSAVKVFCGFVLP